MIWPADVKMLLFHVIFCQVSTQANVILVIFHHMSIRYIPHQLQFYNLFYDKAVANNGRSLSV